MSRDRAKAMGWLLMAANIGHMKAQADPGGTNGLNDAATADPERGALQMSTVRDFGNPDMQHLVGRASATGMGGPRD